MRSVEQIYSELPYCHSMHRYIRSPEDIQAIVNEARASAFIEAAEIARAKEEDLARHYGIQPAMDVVNALLAAAQKEEGGK
jgi:hypothetical protein